MFRKLKTALLIGLIAWIGIVALSRSEKTALWQEYARDLLFTQRLAPLSQPNPTQNIKIIAIDNLSLQGLGPLPWPRAVFTQLLSTLNKQPAVVGIDLAPTTPENLQENLTFSTKGDPQEDITFANALKEAGNVVLAAHTSNPKITSKGILWQSVTQPLNQFSDYSDIGVTNLNQDKDGIVRSISFFFDTTEGKLSHFSKSIVEVYGHSVLATQPDFFKTYDPIFEKESEKGEMLINYVGGPSTFRTYSFIDVLHNRVKPEEFKDSIVLVGITAEDLTQPQLVPGKINMSTIEIQANVLNTLLTRHFLHEETETTTLGLLFGVSIVASLVLMFLSPLFGAFFLFALAVGYYAFALQAFNQGTIHNLTYLPLLLLTLYILHIVYKGVRNIYQHVTRQESTSPASNTQTDTQTTEGSKNSPEVGSAENSAEDSDTNQQKSVKKSAKSPSKKTG